MCWRTTESFPDALERRTAVKDIVAYKVLRLEEGGRFFSYLQGFEYTPQRTCVLSEDLVMSKDVNGDRTINEGFHSYGGGCIVKTWGVSGMIGIYGQYRYKLLYLYDSMGMGNYDCDSGDTVFARCVIPEGSAYYENERGEIVSDGICLTKDYVPYDELMDFLKGSNDCMATFDEVFEHLKAGE